MAEITTRLLGPVDLGASELVLRQLGRGQVEAAAGVLPELLRAPNLGLLWQRYFPAHDLPQSLPESCTTPCGLSFQPLWDGLLADQRLSGDERKKRAEQALKTWRGAGAVSWYCSLAREVTNEESHKELLAALHERRRQALLGPPIWIEARAVTRLLIGQGNAAPLENSGISLGDLYGFPYLPAASLKGLLRHWLEEEVAYDVDVALPSPHKEAGREEASRRRAVARLVHQLLGENEATENEGSLVFYDGWPWAEEAAGWLEPEVLTVHHQGYYSGDTPASPEGGQPVPVHFVAIRPGTRFLFALGWRSGALVGEGDTAPGEALRWATEQLGEVLRHWGLGAKTGSGYGIMEASVGWPSSS